MEKEEPVSMEVKVLAELEKGAAEVEPSYFQFQSFKCKLFVSPDKNGVLMIP